MLTLSGTAVPTLSHRQPQKSVMQVRIKNNAAESGFKHSNVFHRSHI